MPLIFDFAQSQWIFALKDLLKRSDKETEIRSAHTRINLAEILSRPVVLDLDNLFR